MMTVRKVESIAELLTNLAADNASYQGAIWFRGHADLSWSLIPGYYRISSPPSEGTLLKRFKQSAAMLIDRQPGDTFDWLFLMQHYGVPTRLLDWTESPLVALYFAVSDQAYETHDGALWLLKPTELNKDAGIHGSEEFFIPSFEDDELKNYSVEILAHNPRQKLNPIATIATRNNPRIQSQLGVFTIHHSDACAIEGVGDKDHINKYKIPHSAKSALKEELRLLGYNKFQLFPELASIGDIIKEGL